MKKLITILLIGAAFISCEKEDTGCKCMGEYALPNGGTFFAMNVNCDTGERESSPIQSNAIYLGCAD